MKQIIEAEVILPKVSVHLATIEWRGVEDVAPRPSTYSICQRLSQGHSPLRIENINAREAFPHERSVGFLPPDCSVRLFPLDAPFKVLNCAFEKDYFEQVTGIGRADWEEHTGELVAIKDRRMEVLMQELHSELLLPDFARDLLVESVCDLLLVAMARYARRLGADTGGVIGRALAPWQLRRIRERIEASPEQGYPSLGELAELCGISQSHLMRSFKLSTGWPVHKFVAQERLLAAKKMLADEELSSKEISVRLGFRNPAYFATAFRRMTGKTPTDYRMESRAMRCGKAGEGSALH